MKSQVWAGRTVVSAIMRGVSIGIILGLVFAAGFLVRGAMPPAAASLLTPPSLTPDSAVGQYPLLTQVQTLLNQHYLRDQPSQRELEYAAIRGVLGVLNDKYTFLVDPPVAHSESDVLAGQYGGIGVQINRDDKGNFLLYPFKDAPAIKAGVKDGDMLLQVNGKDVPLNTQPDALDQMLRGEVKDNNGVTIQVLRSPSNQKLDFTIPFAVIEVPSVIWHTLANAPTFGYVQIMRFTNRTPDEVKNALVDLQSQKIQALVLDLRNNPGGLLQESINVAGEFLGAGTVLYEKTRDGEKSYDAQVNSLLPKLPMVVLVNGNTASAAELVAAAIHDRKRAMVIGQKTYGKGSVQLIFSLSDQSSLHVTTAEWLPPSKTPLDGVGLTPDIPVTPDPGGRDVELGEAIKYLSDHLVI